MVAVKNESTRDVPSPPDTAMLHSQFEMPLPEPAKVEEDTPAGFLRPSSGAWWLNSDGAENASSALKLSKGEEAKLRRDLDTVLDRALQVCLDTQDQKGAWQVEPDPRLFDTGLVAHVMTYTHEPAAEAAVAQAKAWLGARCPQNHELLAALLDETPRKLLQGGRPTIDLREPSLYSDIYRRKTLLLFALGELSGAEVLSPYGLSEVKSQVRQFYVNFESIQMKQRSKIELAAIYALLEAATGNMEVVEAVCDELLKFQESDGSYCHSVMSSSLVMLALTLGKRKSDAWRRCFEHLIAAQRADGTWRFFTSDVWDTSLLLRAYGRHPRFAGASSRAVEFLLSTQNEDGGWGFRQGVESDNDTSSCVLLALKNQRGRDISSSVERGIAYLNAGRRKDGLWDTWQSRDDHPVEDCVAHVVTALVAFRREPESVVGRAQRWLEKRYERNGRWTAGWYRSLPYSTLEVGRALHHGHPIARQAAQALRLLQNSDGGFPQELGEQSLPSATGLAMAVLAQQYDFHRLSLKKALRYLKDQQRADGTWRGGPEMFGPRPLMYHLPTNTHAFVGHGLMAAWLRLN